MDGFDFSQFAIDKAQKKVEEFNLTKIQFQCDDIFKFTSEKKFDLIIISEVLEHLSDDLSILKKYSSFVKDSGYIIVSVPFNQRLWSYEDEHAGHVRRYTQ